MEDVLTRIKKEFEQFNEIKEKLVEELRKSFPEILKPLFEQSKKITSIGWTQYTPYFNDGDICEFSVHYDDLEINEMNPYGDDEDYVNFWDETIWDHRRIPNPDYDPNEAEILNKFKEVLCGIPEEFYEDLFGDHARITIYKDGTIRVDEYGHD